MNKNAIIGNEYDETLFARLKDALLSQHAILLDKNWGAVGSQEISVWNVRVGNKRLVIEAETYTGLSLSGPADLVSQIALSVAEQPIKE